MKLGVGRSGPAGHDPGAGAARLAG